MVLWMATRGQKIQLSVLDRGPKGDDDGMAILISSGTFRP
jgi:hypothetical protein